jgi:hypothetical protein
LRRERDSLDAAALVERITIGFRDLTWYRARRLAAFTAYQCLISEHFAGIDIHDWLESHTEGERLLDAILAPVTAKWWSLCHNESIDSLVQGKQN